jgi:hypothetical protein
LNSIDEIIDGMMIASPPSSYWTGSNMGFPELEISKSTIQRNNQSVWQHTMDVIDVLEERNPITLLSGLFHDLGKCRIKSAPDISESKFPGHEAESVIVAKNKLVEWGCPDRILDGVVRIISTHMYDISVPIKEKTMRNFIASIGARNINDWFILRLADAKSYPRQHRYYRDYVKPFRIAVLSFLNEQPQHDQSELVDPSILGNIHIEGGDT